MSLLDKLRAVDANADHAARLARLHDLANQVTHGLRNFARAGAALATIRDEQLYRLTHRTFEDYCQQTWRMTPQHARRLMDAADVARNLEPMGSIPPNERQARSLATLSPDQQRQAWTEANAAGTPTVATVEEAVARRQPGRSPARRRKPKPLRVKLPRAIVVIERRTADQDAIAILHQAIAKLSELRRDAAA